MDELLLAMLFGFSTGGLTMYYYLYRADMLRTRAEYYTAHPEDLLK